MCAPFQTLTVASVRAAGGVARASPAGPSPSPSSAGGTHALTQSGPRSGVCRVPCLGPPVPSITRKCSHRPPKPHCLVISVSPLYEANGRGNVREGRSARGPLRPLTQQHRQGLCTTPGTALRAADRGRRDRGPALVELPLPRVTDCNYRTVGSGCSLEKRSLSRGWEWPRGVGAVTGAW